MEMLNFIANFCVFVLFICEAYEVPETNVMDDLFYEYYREARPATKRKPVVKVSHQLSINRVISLVDNLLVIDTWQVISWEDPRLEWDKSYHEDVDSLNLDPSKVWKPDIVNFNNAGGNSGLIYNNLPLVVYHTGQVVYIPPTRLTTQCSPNGEVFHCIWTFGSWTHDIRKLDLNNTQGRLDMSEYEESPKIAIIGSSVHRRLKKYACCPDRYAVVTYNLTIRWKDTDRFRGLEPLQMPEMSSNTTSKGLLQNDAHIESSGDPPKEVLSEKEQVNVTKDKSVYSNESYETSGEREENPPESIQESDNDPVVTESGNVDEVATESGNVDEETVTPADDINAEQSEQVEEHSEEHSVTEDGREVGGEDMESPREGEGEVKEKEVVSKETTTEATSGLKKVLGVFKYFST